MIEKEERSGKDRRDRIRKIRKEKGLTQKQMAEEFGVGLSTIQRYEGGNSVPGGMLLVDLAMQGYNLHWLMTGDGDKYSFQSPAKGPKNLHETLSSDINQDILTDAIEGLEEALRIKGRTMSPQRKAEILSEIYMWLLEDEKAEENAGRKNLAKILKFVA